MLDRRARPRVDAGKQLEALGLQYPLSPVSPPQLPTQSRRRASSAPLYSRRAAARPTPLTPRTGPPSDLTIACDSLPRPSKKRRVSDSSEATLSEETIVTKTQERETCVPAGLGGMRHGPRSDFDSEAAISSGSRSRSVSRATSASPPATSSSPFTAATSSVEQRPTPPPSASLAKAHFAPRIRRHHVRPPRTASSLAAPNAAGGTRRGPIQAFLPSASWDALRSHCEDAHPRLAATS
ncbi:hypothetical protein C8F04DRAFT_1171737, partial [Mycena alexandri]